MSSHRKMAALGSSFAAGPGIEPVVDKAAMRSGRNYAHLVAEQLGAHLTDLTVSGATTATILDTAQRVGLARYPPQISSLPGDVDLITITAGGNDLKYAGSMLLAGWAGWLQTRRGTRMLGRKLATRGAPRVSPDDVERATAGLARIVTVAREHAPLARILLVDYLTVLGRDTRPSPTSAFDTDTIRGFRAVSDSLAAAFAGAVERTGAKLVRVSAISEAHGIGSPEPWVNDLVTKFSLTGSSFHPNAAGMRAVADEILRTLDGN